MLTVDDDGRIRRAHRGGMSLRAVARTLHHARRKIRQVLACPEPRPYTRTKDRPAPKLGPLTPIIVEILKADEKEPRKQRHTAAQIFRSLRDEHGPQESPWARWAAEASAPTVIDRALSGLPGGRCQIVTRPSPSSYKVLSSEISCAPGSTD